MKPFFQCSLAVLLNITMIAIVIDDLFIVYIKHAAVVGIGKESINAIIIYPEVTCKFKSKPVCTFFVLVGNNIGYSCSSWSACNRVQVYFSCWFKIFIADALFWV